MGIWGARVFENDAASDFLDHAVDELRTFIDDDLAKCGEDSVLERPVLAAVACLRAILCGTCDTRQAAVLVPRTVVEHWQAEYARWFEETLPRAGLEKPVLEAMRENARAEFQSLLTCLA